MLGYVLTRYGRLEGSSLMEVPAPTFRPRDILVDVRAAGLNPVDFKFRQGKLRAIYRPRLPLVLGNEFAGEVVAVAPLRGSKPPPIEGAPFHLTNGPAGRNRRHRRARLRWHSMRPAASPTSLASSAGVVAV